MNRKKFLVLRLAAYAVAAVGLVLWISWSRRDRAFDEYRRHWDSLDSKGAEAIDSAEVAQRLAPLLNESGVEFLRKKALTGKGEDAAVAVVALDIILGAVKHTPQENPEAAAKVVRPLNGVDMNALNERALAATTNPVLREMLLKLAVQALGPSATSPTNAVENLQGNGAAPDPQ